MVTMSDVARLAGVSKMTVSNVVNKPARGERPRTSARARSLQQSGCRLNVNARTQRTS
jgi:DNA-binding LacI/PurR family transcriptional regulator